MVGLAKSKVLVVPQEFRGFDYPAMVGRLRGDWDVAVWRCSSELSGKTEQPASAKPRSGRM